PPAPLPPPPLHDALPISPPPRPVPPERDSRIARLLPRVAALGADPRAPGSADGAAAAGGDGGARAVAGLLGTDHQLHQRSQERGDRKSTRLNSSHVSISY